ncbi:MAG: DUF2442 domain-containing protein [Campylobacterales bacterium]|nr:DUF2442 domain-containing protein [Campylobacterales bacterium]
MKLTDVQLLKGYTMVLVFENAERYETDLQPLLGSKITADEMQTARINNEWGCLEFLSGTVDIEPKTLYRFVTEQDAIAS